MHRQIVLALIGLVILGAGAYIYLIRVQEPLPELDYWPTDGWRVAPPSELGL